MPSCLHVHHGLHHWPTCLHEQPGPQAPTFCTPAHITLFGRGPNEDLNAIMMRSASGECGHERTRPHEFALQVHRGRSLIGHFCNSMMKVHMIVAKIFISSSPHSA